jgi:hypothetical protein
MLQVLTALKLSDIELNIRIITMFIIVNVGVVQMKPVRGTAGEYMQSQANSCLRMTHYGLTTSYASEVHV